MEQFDLLPTEKKTDWKGMGIAAVVLIIVILGGYALETTNSNAEGFGWLRQAYPTLSEKAFNRFCEINQNSTPDEMLETPFDYLDVDEEE